MSFADIETLLEARLPRTAWLSAKWWCNEDTAKTRHVQSKAWMQQGYRAEVNIPAKVVCFYGYLRRDLANETSLPAPFTSRHMRTSHGAPARAARSG
jgi:hypothetical protein